MSILTPTHCIPLLQLDEADRKQALDSSAADSYRVPAFWNRIPGFGGGHARPKN